MPGEGTMLLANVVIQTGAKTGSIAGSTLMWGLIMKHMSVVQQ